LREESTLLAIILLVLPEQLALLTVLLAKLATDPLLLPVFLVLLMLFRREICVAGGRQHCNLKQILVFVVLVVLYTVVFVGVLPLAIFVPLPVVLSFRAFAATTILTTLIDTVATEEGSVVTSYAFACTRLWRR
jgi:hypothetical protein